MVKSEFFFFFDKGKIGYLEENKCWSRDKVVKFFKLHWLANDK
jgi:hypothetical protein